MNTKSILFASCVAAITLTASVAMAGRHGGGFGGGGPSGGGFRGSSAHAGMAPGFARGGSRFGSGFSRGFRGDRDFHHRRDFVFFGDFGDPFFFYPYYWGYYPYGYYPYGYYPYGYYPYGYGYGSDNQAVYPSVAVGRGSSVRKIQLRLARAGFYHGSIDGIMGARTRSAMRAYERSRVTER
jgi:hypothetical protein